MDGVTSTFKLFDGVTPLIYSRQTRCDDDYLPGYACLCVCTWYSWQVSLPYSHKKALPLLLFW